MDGVEYDYDRDNDDFGSSAAGGQISSDVCVCNNNDTGDNDDDSIDENRLEYFTPPSVPDADVLFSANLYANTKSFSPPANHHRGSEGKHCSQMQWHQNI